MARWQPAEREARYLKARKAGRPVVVSEGDSWFDYPMYRNIIDRVDDTKRFALKRLEFSGDTVANMVGNGKPWAGLASLKAVVEHERPRFVLFSGGGNDIVGDEFTGAVKLYDPGQTPEWHIDTEIWRNLKQSVQGSYDALANGIGPLAPVFAHGYDYIIPANKPVRYDGVSVAGPWVWKEMNNKDIPDEMMKGISKVMIDWFNGMLATLEGKHVGTGYFGHLDLRNTLTPQLWQNEIHPTAKGFEAIAGRFIERMDEKLTTVLPKHDAIALGVQ